jgi:hypothetical protein
MTATRKSIMQQGRDSLDQSINLQSATLNDTQLTRIRC